MSKFSVFVPFDGKREKVVSYFKNDDVVHLFKMENFVSLETVPVGSTDSVVVAVADVVARKFMKNGLFDSNVIAFSDDTAYEFIGHDGVQVGYEVMFRTENVDEFIKNNSLIYNSDGSFTPMHQVSNDDAK